MVYGTQLVLASGEEPTCLVRIRGPSAALTWSPSPRIRREPGAAPVPGTGCPGGRARPGSGSWTRPASTRSRLRSSPGRRFGGAQRGSRARSGSVNGTRGVDSQKAVPVIHKCAFPDLFSYQAVTAPYPRVRVADRGDRKWTGATPPFFLPGAGAGVWRKLHLRHTPWGGRSRLNYPLAGRPEMTPVTGKMGCMNTPDIHKEWLGGPQEASGGEAPRPPRLPLSGLRLSELPERLSPLQRLNPLPQFVGTLHSPLRVGPRPETRFSIPRRRCDGGSGCADLHSQQ